MSLFGAYFDINVRAKDDTEPLTLAATRAQVLHSRVVVLSQGIQMLAQAYMQLQFSQMRQMIAQDLVENAQFRLSSSQDRYNQAVAQYGPGSQQAIQASRELTIAQNQLERATSRTNMMLQHQYLEIIPMGLSVLTALTSITWALGAAEGARGGARGLARFALYAAAAGVIGAGAIAASQTMKHHGGVIPETGYYYLERGESVNASRGADTGGGGMSLNVSILGYQGMNSRQLLYDIWEQGEREKRKRVPQKERRF